MAAAAVGHALDRAGQLPLVHEDVAVRTAMSPGLVICWLLVAATLSALAAATGPLLLGAPCALLVAGAPELLGRHDIGAVTEPGAVAGALVQWLLIAAVVALMLVAEREFRRQPFRSVVVAGNWAPPAAVVSGLNPLVVVGSSRSRAPPARTLSS